MSLRAAAGQVGDAISTWIAVFLLAAMPLAVFAGIGLFAVAFSLAVLKRQGLAALGTFAGAVITGGGGFAIGRLF